jgi:hypothetical protein
MKAAGKPDRASAAVACDAAITPVVTGDVNPGVLDDLAALCLQLAGHSPHCAPQPDADPASDPAPVSHPGPAGEPVPAGSGGLDPGPEPRRHRHRLEPRPHQGPAQSQPPGPRRVNRPASHPLLNPETRATIVLQRLRGRYRVQTRGPRQFVG